MKADVVIIGGGYYGYAAAIEVRRSRPDLSVLIVEKAKAPFTRASATNQGQLHAGYMYSKFPELARECVHGAQEFAMQYGDAIIAGNTTFYGVHKGSEISATDYEAFCEDVGLPLRHVDTPSSDFFGDALAQVYETVEKSFDNATLHRLMSQRLAESGGQIITSFDVAKIRKDHGAFVVESADGQVVEAGTVFNATFADINKIHELSGIAKLPLEHAVYLHFLVDVPAKYSKTGVIVVRGAYAALVPAISAASHVFASGQFRTLRTSKIDAPSENVTDDGITMRYRQAVDEASSYMPILRTATLRGHTIGTRTNYVDPQTGIAASRAVVLQDYDGIHGYHCIFGGKVTCLPEITEPVRRICGIIGA